MSDYTPTPEAVEAFKRAWHEADAEGDAGNRTLRGLTAAGPLIERAVRERVERDILARMPDDDAWANTCDDYRAAGWDGTPDDYERMFWESAHRAAARIARGEGS